MSAYSGPKSAPSGLVFAVDAGSTEVIART